MRVMEVNAFPTVNIMVLALAGSDEGKNTKKPLMTKNCPTTAADDGSGSRCAFYARIKIKYVKRAPSSAEMVTRNN